jgi:hypothetical protein
MSFTSQLSAAEPIIHETSPIKLIETPDGMSRGLDLGLRGPGDYEYGAVADPFPPELLIPMGEVQARIQEMEATKSRISDLIRAVQLPPKDQARTNYCWGNAPTHCCEIVRVQQGLPMVILSPASACAQIKNYKNVGGWGQEALQFIVDRGLVPVDHWPANAIDPKYATPANKQLALNYRVVEWNELKPRNLQQLLSMLESRLPSAIRGGSMKLSLAIQFGLMVPLPCVSEIVGLVGAIMDSVFCKDQEPCPTMHVLPEQLLYLRSENAEGCSRL